MTYFEDPPEELTPIEKEALVRVQMLGSGRASRQEIEDTKLWGRQSSAHAEALARASLLWDQLGPAGHNFLKRRGEAVLPGLRSEPRLSRRVILGGEIGRAHV